MQLRLAKAFLTVFWRSLYFSILPEYALWGSQYSFIVEPICTFRVRGSQIIDCRPLEAWLDPSFQLMNVRGLLADQLEDLDNNWEQSWFRQDDYIYEVREGPFGYPDYRVERFLNQLSERAINGALFDGLCHFHPTARAEPSPADRNAMDQLAGLLEGYGKHGVYSLIIASGKPFHYIKVASGLEHRFSEHMTENVNRTIFDCRRFYSQAPDERIELLFPSLFFSTDIQHWG